jgi:hypothetical protein
MKLFSTVLLFTLLSAVLIESSPVSSIFKFLRKKKGATLRGEGTPTTTATGEPLPNTIEMDSVLDLGRSMLERYDPNKASYSGDRERLANYWKLVNQSF